MQETQESIDMITYPDGSQEWRTHRVRHRDGDLPAHIGAEGTLEWWKNGGEHRDGDLPAVIEANGTYAWYHNGVLLNNEQVWEQIYARILHENARKVVLMYGLGVPRDIGMEICKYI